jgi:hypothetical protein
MAAIDRIYTWRVVYKDGSTFDQFSNTDDFLFVGERSFAYVPTPQLAVRLELIPVIPESAPIIKVRITPKHGDRLIRMAQQTINARTGEPTLFREVVGLQRPGSEPVYILVDPDGTIWLSSSLDF